MKQDVVEVIGTFVVKTSRKPFKSKLKQNTVKGYMIHPLTGKDCYTFIEDDSYVECFRCVKYMPS